MTENKKLDHPGGLNRAEYYLNSKLNRQVNVALQHNIWKFFHIKREEFNKFSLKKGPKYVKKSTEERFLFQENPSLTEVTE